LTQGYPSEQLEILVVDDGSTDDTRERVAKYGERIQYLYKANGGQASAFNFGISHAKGEIIALLDADDYWLPGKLKRVAKAFAEEPRAGLVYHRFRELRSDTGHMSEGSFNAITGDVPKEKKKILLYTACQTSGLSFRKSLVSHLLPLNEAMTIQADGLLAALIIFVAPVVAIDDPLAVYRIHGANLYFQSGALLDKQRQARRISTLKVILDEMDLWLIRNGFNLSQPETLAFRRRWRLLYESEEFQLERPGRLKFCLHLVRAMSNMNPCLNWKIQMVNLINVVGALFFGYRDYDRLDLWRRTVAGKMHSS
jgi:glycosyltransferase involved in cell wall biosynthesis